MNQNQPPPAQRPKQTTPSVPPPQEPDIVNPYARWPEDRQFRLNVDIDIGDAMFLKSISPRYGSTQTIVSIYVKSIIDECRQLGITSYSPENYNRLVAIIKRRTAPHPTGVNSGQNDSRATQGVHQTNPDVAHLAAESTSEAGQGLEGGGKGKTRRQKR